MGSSSSKSSGVRITRVAEYRPPPDSEDEPINVTPVVSSQHKPTQKTNESDEKTTQKDGSAQKALSAEFAAGASRKGLDKNGKVKRIIEPPDLKSVPKAIELKSILPPIHYVEKNEGGMVVEDVDTAPTLSAKEVISDRGDEIRESFKSICSSLPESDQNTTGGIRPLGYHSKLSLPGHEAASETAISKLAPISGTCGTRLGVSGRSLIDQLHTQGIITQDSTQYVDTASSSILGELTHLGLIQDSEDEKPAMEVIFDESERRKIPARLSKLPKQNEKSSFPTPDGKRIKTRTRSHGLGCGLQLNEDVVSNALQRASVRERKVTVKPADENSTKDLVQETIST